MTQIDRKILIAEIVLFTFLHSDITCISSALRKLVFMRLSFPSYIFAHVEINNFATTYGVITKQVD